MYLVISGTMSVGPFDSQTDADSWLSSHGIDTGVVTMADTTIGWTRPLLEQFKQRYDQAVKNGELRFEFEVNGVKHDFITAYAKYLIEYLESTHWR